MATVTSTGIALTSDPALFYHLQGANAYFAGATSTNFTLAQTSTGETWAFTGAGFSGYSNGYPSSGTVTSLTYSNFYGQSVTISDVSISVSTALSYLNAGNVDGLLNLVFSGADTFTGTEWKDLVNGFAGADVIYGGGGDDYLHGGDGADTVYGGDGADDLVGGADADILDGGAGDDFLYSDPGADTLLGGAGNDTVVLAGGDTADGGEGYDKIYFALSSGASLASSVLLSQTQVTLSNGAKVQGFEIFDVTLNSAANTFMLDTALFGFNSLYMGGGIDTLAADLSTYSVGVTLARTLSDRVALRTVYDFLSVYEVERVSITGTSYDDALEGLSGADILSGGGGDDALKGGDGDDQLDGGSGDDALGGGYGDDQLDGGDGNDRLFDGDSDGNDTLNGGDGNDKIDSGGGVNTVSGGAGDDEITSGGTLYVEVFVGQDTIDGGAGQDTVSLLRTASTASFTLSDSMFDGGAEVVLGDGTVLRNVELLGSVLAGSGDDTVHVSRIRDGVISGGAGTDELTVDFSSFTDALRMDADELRFSVWPSSTLSIGGFEKVTYIAGSGHDTLEAGAGVYELFGGAGNDTLTGGGGNSVLSGGDGIDSITSTYGVDTIDGGADMDLLTLNRESASASFTVSLAAIASNAGATLADGTSVKNIERLSFTAGSGDDTLIVDTALIGDGVFAAGGGTDTLVVDLSGSNADIEVLSSYVSMSVFDLWLNGVEQFDIQTGAGWDYLAAGDFSDTLSSGAGNDTLAGAGGDDLLIGGAGADFINGGAGLDTASYADSAAGVNVNLSTNSATQGDAEGDSIFGVEKVIGSAFGDVLAGDMFANEFDGGEGNDTFFIGAGDIARGGAGDDDYRVLEDGAAIVENDGDSDDRVEVFLNTYTLGANLEHLVFSGVGGFVGVGNALANTVTGHSGSDTLSGLAGEDVLAGADGDDTLIGGAGADSLVGGDGSDTASYATSFGAVDVRLFNNTALGGEATGDTFNSIENLIGTAKSDVLVGNDGINTIWGGDGGDAINGRDGADTLHGQAGADQLLAGAGDDILIGGAGADTLGGGGGIDTADYSASSTGVTIDLSPQFGAGIGGDAQGDELVSIENVIASAFADTITGKNGVANMLAGGAGADALYGLSGNDTLGGGAGADLLDGGDGSDTASYADSAKAVDVRLFNGLAAGGDATGDVFVSIENLIGSSKTDTLVGDDGANTIWGGAGNDAINGRDGADTLYGEDGHDVLLAGAGDDVLIGGAGADTLGGGAGTDTASYANASSGVFINLTAQTGEWGDAQGDSIVSCENVIGSAFNDVLVGNAQNNVLTGGGGNDTLSGNGGNDQFVFALGAGSDTIVDLVAGAASADTVRLVGFGAAFDTAAEVLAAATQDGLDVVINFGAGQTLTLQMTTLANLHADDFVFG